MEDWISREATINGTDFICHKPNPDGLWQKEKDAIERLKAFEPKDGEPYYLCYSGGKDSDVIRILAQLAGVRHEIHHNLTTVDAPETIAYIKTIPNVMIDKARYDDGTPNITHWMPLPKIPKKERDMRKIIRHGNVNDKKDRLYYFKCERCGCEWIADSNSISSHVGGMGHIWINSNCPECDKIESVDTAIR